MSVKKDDYQVYHNLYSRAIGEALEYAEAKGYKYSDDEYFNKVACGPKRPAEGVTNTVSLTLCKDDKESKKALHIQIYGMKDKYELNTYIA